MDITPIALAQHPQSVNVVVCNNKWFLTGSSDGTLRKFDLIATANGKQRLTQAQMFGNPPSMWRAGVQLGSFQQKDAVYSLVMEKQSLWSLSGQHDGSICLNTLRHDFGTHLHTLSQHVAPVSALVLNKSENVLISGSFDKQVIQWSLDTGSAMRSFRGATSPVSCIQNHQQQENVILITTYAGQQIIYDTRKEQPLKELMSNSWCVSSAWSFDGNSIYSGHKDETVSIWDIRMGKVQQTLRLQINSGAVSSLKVLNERYLLIGSHDSIRLWDFKAPPKQATPFRVVSGHYSGMLSDMVVQDNFLLSSSGVRGYDSFSDTHQCILYEIEDGVPAKSPMEDEEELGLDED